ncbi:hypothetical protein GCM10023088_51630 [Actinomadura verrucosospora]
MVISLYTHAMTVHDTVHHLDQVYGPHAADPFGSDEAPLRLAGMYAWNASTRTILPGDRSSSTSSVPTWACRRGPHRDDRTHDPPLTGESTPTWRGTCPNQAETAGRNSH